MSATLVQFVKDDEGATMVEYGLMVALIAVVCIVVVAALGQNIGARFQDTNTAIVNSGPNQVQP
jgi:pilus assembly protein Flp/PilA